MYAAEAFRTTGAVHIEDCEGWCGTLVPRLLCESLGMRLVVWVVRAGWCGSLIPRLLCESLGMRLVV